MERYFQAIFSAPASAATEAECLLKACEGPDPAEVLKARLRELGVFFTGSTNSLSNLSISLQTIESLLIEVSVTVFLFKTFSLRVLFLLSVSQKDVSSEFSSTHFNLFDSSNFDIFSFPFLVGRIEENERLLTSFLGLLPSNC